MPFPDFDLLRVCGTKTRIDGYPDSDDAYTCGAVSNCEFNGFTVFLRSDGKLAGGSRYDEVPRDVMLSRIRAAQDYVQDDTIFVIADPDASYGDFAALIADIHGAAPRDHIAAVTRAGQIQAWSIPGGVSLDFFADRRQFEWPAVIGQSKKPVKEPIPLPGGRISVWEALRNK
ncbi:MAG: hypothetical protein ABR906_01710 [Terracidiphilus sp.]